MRVFDLTKKITPICTVSGKERSGHIDSLKLTARSCEMVAEMLIELGYDDDAEIVYGIAARVHSEAQFLPVMARAVYVRGE